MLAGLTKMRSLLLVVAVVVAAAWADTPANCTYEDIRGTWLFMEGKRGNDKTLNCDKFTSVNQMKMTLLFPDVAVDQYGNEGFWTIIYNQGFEVVVAGRKYFAFSKYTQDGQNVTSFCDQTLNGWSHNVLISDWACFNGYKTVPQAPKIHAIPAGNKMELPYRANKDYMDKINSIQSMWKASTYPHFEKKTREDLVRMAGGSKSRVNGKVKAAPITAEVAAKAAQLPLSFDWRNVSGVSYVSPVRNQESCGSCFAFSSVAMHEARGRIRSGNGWQPVLSPQDVVECSEYSQGCEGGFPYLVGGKYAEDFGLVDEDCNPYTGKDGNCSTSRTCARHYGTGYHYIGGFYGGCNEALMRLSLVNNGPFVVGFEVYSDFFSYKSGIYVHTGVRDNENFGYDPFELTNHAVLVVGYGVEDLTQTPFWIVKNSWSEQWGEMGYFRILRGVDEVAIESIAVESDPIM